MNTTENPTREWSGEIIKGGFCAEEEGTRFVPLRYLRDDHQGAMHKAAAAMVENVSTPVLMIPTERIVPNPAQPRRRFSEESLRRLADSIRLHGIIQPLSVRDCGGAVFELIAGERRLKSAKIAGLERVPCILVNADSAKSAELAIIENIQREDLNMFEEAAAIFTLMQVHCLTQEKIASELSCSQSYVANKLRLLRLSPEARTLILEAELTERHARALLRIRDTSEQYAALKTVIGRHMNVARCEEYIDCLLASPAPCGKNDADARVRHVYLQNVKIFYNTVDRAVDFMREAGVNIISEYTDCGDETEIRIRLPKDCTQTASKLG